MVYRAPAMLAATYGSTSTSELMLYGFVFARRFNSRPTLSIDAIELRLRSPNATLVGGLRSMVSEMEDVGDCSE